MRYWLYQTLRDLQIHKICPQTESASASFFLQNCLIQFPTFEEILSVLLTLVTCFFREKTTSPSSEICKLTYVHLALNVVLQNTIRSRWSRLHSTVYIGKVSRNVAFPFKEHAHASSHLRALKALRCQEAAVFGRVSVSISTRWRLVLVLRK